MFDDVLIDQYQLYDVDIIIDTFRRVSKNPKNLIHDDNTCTRNGIQTENIFQLNDFKPILSILQDIRRYISKAVDSPLDYYWAHMIEYQDNGWQRLHHHAPREDVSFILYLTDNDDGQTFFKIDNDGLEYQIHVYPKKGKLVFFDAKYDHGAKLTTGNKMVLVGGLRYSKK